MVVIILIKKIIIATFCYVFVCVFLRLKIARLLVFCDFFINIHVFVVIPLRLLLGGVVF